MTFQVFTYREEPNEVRTYGIREFLNLCIGP